jgi:hypothetical protein
VKSTLLLLGLREEGLKAEMGWQAPPIDIDMIHSPYIIMNKKKKKCKLTEKLE